MFLAVTADKYELPLSWAFSLSDLALRMGIDYNTLWHELRMHRDSKLLFNGFRYRIVFVDVEG